jgi:predicted RNA-binding Zn-ribbon protein involved in translation (DUF1610 family)
MERAVSSGWTCRKCGAQRIRTMEMDSIPAKIHGRATRAIAVQSRCPACGHAELVTAEAGERIISIRYGSS